MDEFLYRDLPLCELVLISFEAKSLRGVPQIDIFFDLFDADTYHLYGQNST